MFRHVLVSSVGRRKLQLAGIPLQAYASLKVIPGLVLFIMLCLETFPSTAIDVAASNYESRVASLAYIEVQRSGIACKFHATCARVLRYERTCLASSHICKICNFGKRLMRLSRNATLPSECNEICQLANICHSVSHRSWSSNRETPRRLLPLLRPTPPHIRLNLCHLHRLPCSGTCTGTDASSAGSF